MEESTCMCAGTQNEGGGQHMVIRLLDTQVLPSAAHHTIGSTQTCARDATSAEMITPTQAVTGMPAATFSP